MSIGSLVFVRGDHSTLDSDFVHLIFDFFGTCRVCPSDCHKRTEARKTQQNTEDAAGQGRTFLSRRRDPNTPGDTGSPDAVGKVKNASNYACKIEQWPNEPEALHGIGK
jgi:hypothetical protein